MPLGFPQLPGETLSQLFLEKRNENVISGFDGIGCMPFATRKHGGR